MQSKNYFTAEMCGYKIDENKNLFKQEEEGFVLIKKLKKDIYRMVNYDNKTYFMDTFGDCFIVEKEIEFLFGILSKPTYFTIQNNRTYSIDKYNRAWVHDLEGEILNISFIKENVIDVNIRGEYCSVTTDGEPLKIEYKGFKDTSIRKERKLMIFNRSFELIKCKNIEKIVQYEDTYVTAVIDGNTKHISLKDHKARQSLRLEEP